MSNVFGWHAWDRRSIRRVSWSLHIREAKEKFGDDDGGRKTRDGSVGEGNPVFVRRASCLREYIRSAQTRVRARARAPRKSNYERASSARMREILKIYGAARAKCWTGKIKHDVLAPRGLYWRRLSAAKYNGVAWNREAMWEFDFRLRENKSIQCRRVCMGYHKSITIYRWFLDRFGNQEGSLSRDKHRSAGTFRTKFR